MPLLYLLEVSISFVGIELILHDPRSFQLILSSTILFTRWGRSTLKYRYGMDDASTNSERSVANGFRFYCGNFLLQSLQMEMEGIMLYMVILTFEYLPILYRIVSTMVTFSFLWITLIRVSLHYLNNFPIGVLNLSVSTYLMYMLLNSDSKNLKLKTHSRLFPP